MSLEARVSDVVVQLEGLGFAPLKQWLAEALRGEQSLPRLVGDEPSDIAILRLEPSLSKATRRDLEKACLELVQAMVHEPSTDAEYVGSLLGLAVRFELDVLAPQLVDLARRFSEIPGVALAVRHKVLGALIDLKVPQSEEFWLQILSQDPVGHGALVVAGLLVSRPAAALAALPKLPDDVRLAQSVAIVLETYADSLSASDRTAFVKSVRARLDDCNLTVASSISEWLSELGEAVPQPKSEKRAKIKLLLMKISGAALMPSSAKLQAKDAA